MLCVFYLFHFWLCHLACGNLVPLLGIEPVHQQVLLFTFLMVSCEAHACSVAQSCLTLFYPMDCSPPGFSVHGIFQARILEWIAISSSRGSFSPRDWSCFPWSLSAPALQADFFPLSLQGSPPVKHWSFPFWWRLVYLCVLCCLCLWCLISESLAEYKVMSFTPVFF